MLFSVIYRTLVGGGMSYSFATELGKQDPPQKKTNESMKERMKERRKDDILDVCMYMALKVAILHGFYIFRLIYVKTILVIFFFVIVEKKEKYYCHLEIKKVKFMSGNWLVGLTACQPLLGYLMPRLLFLKVVIWFKVIYGND